MIEGRVHDLDSPASLFIASIADGIELHRGEEMAPGMLSFRTFGESRAPVRGREYVVQWWWMPGTQQMLLEAPYWRPERATRSAPDFCYLNYERIDEADEAYTDDRGKLDQRCRLGDVRSRRSPPATVQVRRRIAAARSRRMTVGCQPSGRTCAAGGRSMRSAVSKRPCPSVDLADQAPDWLGHDALRDRARSERP